eukprot:CAMPEP_0113586564 /NCGR_PEP_ID=MMETSP0015_2-20120614/34366_1 /TAXON_ID=2838 /ORGANISM="Odontella" /LENGTH=435 /DNA_ID=CAMNT_0000492013 /DNA_START=41 /DNA_END=1348 /DNA_ORIENTATION=+ /assembly_acc=CAM_ASM_000160
MNETTILLAPAPKAKGDFLATVEPLAPPKVGGGGGAGGDELPFEVTLDNYTRDKWGAVPPAANDPAHWRTVWLKSVDGRKKLPGFLKYLRDRKKSAFGKFESTTEDGSGITRAVLVVPFDQPSPPPECDGTSSGDGVVFCWYALDERKVKGLHRLQPPPKQQQRHPQQGPGRSGPGGRAQQMPPRQQPKKPAPEPGPSKVRIGGKAGLLGNLLGASRRTNEHLQVVPAQKKKEEGADGGEGSGVGGEFGPAVGTSGAAIAKFRTRIEQQLLDFNRSATEVCVKIRVALGEVAKDLPPDQKENVTLDVLKFVLYEQTDEIGEEKWIAQREPGDFLDEMVVAVYKEGHAPEEVLEEMNKGEVPDEIRLQQRALAEARSKEAAKKEAKRDAALHQKMVGGVASADDGFTRLNSAKRDRRTIEEIQKDMEHETKRGRTE